MKEKEYLEELEEEKPSLAKKIFMICAMVLILALFLSYFLLGPHTFDIIESMAESSKMGNLTVEGNGFVVVFNESAYDKLREFYFSNQKYEFKLCLKGSISGKRYFIDSIFIPEIEQQSYANVVSRICPQDTIVDLHSHPYRMCVASKQDFDSFEAFRQINPGAIMMVMCEKDRFYVYGG